MSELAERYFERALTLVRAHDYDKAASLLVEAIKLKPDFTEAWVVRGNILHAQERYFDSLLHFDRAIGINEHAHDAWHNRGNAFADIGMWDSAEESYRRSADLMPAFEPHMGLANMYCTAMRLSEAAAEYQKAIELGAGPDAHFNRGVTLLGLGQWKEGFAQYEQRWASTPYPPRSYRNYPKWRGEDLAGKCILLYPEQGYGDEIMALRFAETVARVHPDAAILIQARAPMLRLAKESGLGGVIAMHDTTALAGVRIDYSCPLLDVPMVLGLEPADLFALRLGRYLRPVPADVATWRERLETLPDGINVGLCWSSGGHLDTARAAQRSKSIPLPWLKPLLIPGVNLISLQFPRETIPPDMPITDWMQDCHDFADTAALIETLDAVISVDTAVAHLAGALGKPVANFVRFSGYWPWLSADVAPSPLYSIWYPDNMMLLRQTRLGDWSGPIQQAVEFVQQRAA